MPRLVVLCECSSFPLFEFPFDFLVSVLVLGLLLLRLVLSVLLSVSPISVVACVVGIHIVEVLLG